MNLTTLHVLPDLTSEPSRTIAWEALRAEAARGASVHVISRAPAATEGGPGVTVHPLDPAKAPFSGDAGSHADSLNLLANARALDLARDEIDLVVVHDPRALPAGRAIADDRAVPLVLREEGSDAGPVVLREPEGGGPRVRHALDSYCGLVGTCTGDDSRVPIDLVIAADPGDWDWVEPLFLHFPSTRVLKTPAGQAAQTNLVRGRVGAFRADREDAVEIYRSFLTQGTLPVGVGHSVAGRGGAMAGCRFAPVPVLAEEIARWLSDEPARQEALWRAQKTLTPALPAPPAPPPVSQPPVPTESRTVETLTERVSVGTPRRPLRVVLNHGGLVADELAQSVAHFGWELKPLLGQGRDPLLSADLLIVLPYGDPRGALSAVQRAKRIGVATAFWNVEDPRYYFDDELGPVTRALAREASATFSTTAQLNLEYRALGIEVTYLPIYGREFFCEPEPLPESERTTDLLFLGTITPDRWQFFDQLRTGLGPEVSLVVRDDVKDPAAMREAVRTARLGLSFGTLTDTAAARGAGVTERVFDYPLAGTPVLSDARTHLPELFEPGQEVFMFRDLPDALAQIRELLGDPDRRRQAAELSRKKVLAQHLGRHRIITIAETLLERRLLQGAFTREIVTRARAVADRDQAAQNRSNA